MDLPLSLNFNLNLNKVPSFEYEAIYDVVIIGAGPSGMNAAIYAARKGLSSCVVCKRGGGRLPDTNLIDNYIGVAGVSGEGLAEKFISHVDSYKVPVLYDVEITSFVPGKSIHQLFVSNGKIIKGKAIIITTGSNYRKLGIPGEDRLFNKGVAYCAICDAPLFKGKDVFVVGGGNSAVQAAIDLSAIASSVKVIHRSVFRADKILIDQMYAGKNVEIILDNRVIEILGDKSVEGVVVENISTGNKDTIVGNGIFIEIGHLPNTGIFKGILPLSPQGEILVNEFMETSVPGVFAAGDVIDFPYKQISISVAQGAIAALSANTYISKNK